MKVQYAAQCSCEPSRALLGGAMPEYYKSESEAARAFLERHEALVKAYKAESTADRYWAVHCRGKHIIAVIPG